MIDIFNIFDFIQFLSIATLSFWFGMEFQHQLSIIEKKKEKVNGE